jgi:hypothetical protein
MTEEQTLNPPIAATECFAASTVFATSYGPGGSPMSSFKRQSGFAGMPKVNNFGVELGKLNDFNQVNFNENRN